MKKILFIFLLLSSIISLAQIKGNITDFEDQPLSFVSIYLEGTVTGTTSNDNGDYVLTLNKTGNYTVVFQILGFKTLKKEVAISKFPFTVNIKMEEENIKLDEISIATKGNPANEIIRNTIENKAQITAKLNTYSADFYSRGLSRIINAPDSFLGTNMGDFGGGLDTTRSGIIYLSETVSKIIAQKNPKKFKEKIMASKVAGEDNGISFSRAENVDFNFYENIVTLGNDLISPISNQAFSYYTYKLVGSFYENGKLINKIAVRPKRDSDRVFKGFMYIVEDDWAIYGTDFTVTGEQANIPIVKELSLKQSYNYAAENDTWVVISQTVEFDAGIFGFNLTGKFSSGYSNYKFNPTISTATFGSEVLSFAENATKKDTVYWNALRPVPLTKEEVTNYKTKDSIKVIRKSKKYLDSVDNTRNRLKVMSLLTSYQYRNSLENWSLSVSSPVINTTFNTVQGFNSTVAATYLSAQNNKGKWWRLDGSLNYGFTDERLRPTVSFTKNWNNFSNPYLIVAAGVKTTQFNARNPISRSNNMIYSLLYRENYMKIYEEAFATVLYSEELYNGFRFDANLTYKNRKPLFNTSNYNWASGAHSYTSNNPLDATNFSASFSSHTIWSAAIGATFVFGQQYLSYPDRKENIGNEKFPKVYVGYRKNFGASNSQLNSDLFLTQVKQNINLGAYGTLKYKVRAGMFAEKKDIAFMDYLHSNGNQVSLVNGDYLNHFGLLEYYRFSTNDKYSEMHFEHNFKGYLWSKIPVLNNLGFHLVGGVKGLFTANTKPYSEYAVGIDNVGFGKWRFLRVDYVQSNFNGAQSSGWLFGITLL